MYTSTIVLYMYVNDIHIVSKTWSYFGIKNDDKEVDTSWNHRKDDKKDGGRSSTPKAPKERTSVTVRSRRSHHVFLKKDLQLDTEGVDSCKQRVTFGEIHRWVIFW